MICSRTAVESKSNRSCNYIISRYSPVNIIREDSSKPFTGRTQWSGLRVEIRLHSDFRNMLLFTFTCSFNFRLCHFNFVSVFRFHYYFHFLALRIHFHHQEIILITTSLRNSCLCFIFHFNFEHRPYDITGKISTMLLSVHMNFSFSIFLHFLKQMMHIARVVKVISYLSINYNPYCYSANGSPGRDITLTSQRGGGWFRFCPPF